MRRISVFCLMAVVVACAGILSASPVTSPAPSPDPAPEELFPGAPLQDYEEDYEDAGALAGGDPEGEDMEAAGALVFRPLFAYRQRQARLRRQRAHRAAHRRGRYHHHHYY